MSKERRGDARLRPEEGRESGSDPNSELSFSLAAKSTGVSLPPAEPFEGSLHIAASLAGKGVLHPSHSQLWEKVGSSCFHVHRKLLIADPFPLLSVPGRFSSFPFTRLQPLPSIDYSYIIPRTPPTLLFLLHTTTLEGQAGKRPSFIRREKLPRRRAGRAGYLNGVHSRGVVWYRWSGWGEGGT